MDRDMHNQQGDIENLPDQLQQGTSGNSSNCEIVIVIRSEETETVSREDGKSKPKFDILDTSKVSGEEERKVEALEPEKDTCVINDIKCSGGSLSGENFNGEKVCRICHLSCEHGSGSRDLIQLGCGCKDELGISHRYCAEAWFRRKGNRKCEICGGTAKNITGIQDTGFMAELNETRLMASATNSMDRESSCWGRQNFCNFLLACLVLAFILPWFFRMDML